MKREDPCVKNWSIEKEMEEQSNKKLTSQLKWNSKFLCKLSQMLSE